MKTIRFIISVAILLLLTVNQGFTQNKVTFRAIVSEGYKKRIYVENIKDDTQKYPTIVLKKENNYSADFELKNKTTCLVSVNINGFERAERLEITDEIKEVTIEVKEGAWKNEVSTSIFRIHKFSLVEWRRRILVDVDYSSVDSCQFVFDSTKTFKESFRNYQQQFYNLYQRMKYVTVLHSYSDRTQENPYDYSVCYLGFKRNPIKQNWLKEALGMKGKNYPYVRYLSFVRSMPLNQALQALDKQTQTHFDYLRQMKDSISQNLYKHLMTDVIFDNYNQKLKAIAYYRDHCDTIKLFNRLKSCSYYFLEQAFSDTCINKKFCIQSNINPYWADLDALLKEKEDFFTGYKIIMSQTNTNPEMEKAQHIYDYVLDTVAFNKPCYSVDSYEYRNFFNTWLNYKKGQFRKQDTTISELKDKYLTVKKYLQGVNTAYFLGEMLVMLKAKDNKEVIELSKDYLKNYKDNYYTSLFSKQLCGIQEVRIGKTAPNFKAKNLTDENVQLKDLRGKWVCLLQDYGRDTTGQGKLNLVFVVITPSKPNNIFSNIQWYISDKENNDYNKYYQNLPYAAILINPKGEVVHFFDYDFLFRNPYNGSLDYVGVNSVNVRTIEALIKKK